MNIMFWFVIIYYCYYIGTVAFLIFLAIACRLWQLKNLNRNEVKK